ncbi:MAG TPA: hypothetical protein VGK52_08920 [Polyangia bacterium]|jgi:hypothetical protein
MRPPLPSVALAFVAATLGCGTVESVSRPPSPAELARIGEASKAAGGLTVRYVQPVGACAWKRCADGVPGAYLHPIDFARLASVDGGTITVESELGRATTIPLSEVKGVAVNGARGRSAAIGAGILGGTAFVVTTVLVAIEEAKIERASDGGDFCGGIACAVPGVALGLVGALVGAGFGYAIGSNKYFSFDPQPKP